MAVAVPGWAPVQVRGVRSQAVTALACAVLAAACGGGGQGAVAPPAGPTAEVPAPPTDQEVAVAPTPARTFPPAPAVPEGDLEPAVAAAVLRLAGSIASNGVGREALATVTDSGDARLAWFVQDLLRFFQGGPDSDALVASFTALTGVDPAQTADVATHPWRTVADHLIAWDLPAPPGYVEAKAELFTAVEPGWAPFFDDPDAAIDWRLVSWGGVLIDDRPLGDPERCANGCIPALDDPALTDAAGGAWYPDDAIVFGITEGGESVALPQNIMQVHEMVNLTLGGRRLGIPYCTLCGSAQAWYTDAGAAQDLVLRTSGLLSRSNKVMYELGTRSVFDTFTGEALSGPLQDAGVVLEQATVVVTTWAQWRAAHPDTRIVAEDGGIGRSYSPDPLGGRDDGGPIFPIGDADPRLPVHAQVLGVVTPDGTPVAFEAEQAGAALAAGEQVTAAGVTVTADAGGLRAALTETGEELPAHQAFWFAWSQFHPATELWIPLGGS